MPRKTRSETNPLYALAVLATLGLCSLVGGPAGATALANESPALFIAILFSGGVVAAILFALFLIIVINWQAGRHRAEQFRLEQENTANLLYRQVVDLSPVEFERAMCKLFEMNGFTVQHSGQTGDGGVDMRMQRGGLKYIGQCKRYQKNPVTVEQIRDFYGTLAHTGADYGYFITTSRFTKPALEFSKHKPLVLVDGPMLKKQISEQEIPQPQVDVPSSRSHQIGWAIIIITISLGITGICLICGLLTFMNGSTPSRGIFTATPSAIIVPPTELPNILTAMAQTQEAAPLPTIASVENLLTQLAATPTP